MKPTGIIFIILYLQATASFMDNFRNAMSNVERGFGKLLTDVVTDVKDTIHCTISAVEQVLVRNGLLDKTSSYSYRCRDLSKTVQPTPVTPPKIRDQRSSFDSFSRMTYPNHEDHQNTPRQISVEIEKSISNVNTTINKILEHHQGHSAPEIVLKEMNDKTNSLTEISNLLSRELQNLSSNIKLQIEKINFNRFQSSIDSIWDEIKALHEIQKSSKNNSEIIEIRNILNVVVDKLRLNSDDFKKSGKYDLKEIRKKLEKISDCDDKNKDKGPTNDLNNIRNQPHQTKRQDAPKTFKDITKKILSNKRNINTDIKSTTEKSLFNLDLDEGLDYLTPILKTNASNEKIVNDAKRIIQDSQRTEKILNDFFNGHRNDFNLFDNPDFII